MLSSRQLLIASATLDVRLKSDILTFVLSQKRLKSVKWIKSYFILKMEINKEKIRYILIDEEEGDVVCVVDWKGIIHYELLSSNQTINSEFYCEQLQKLQQAIERKRPELINRYRLPSRQRSTIHIFDSAKIARAWLGSFNASTV